MPQGHRFTARVVMRWSDMDAYGHVNNVQFLTYLEEARIEMLRDLAREVGDRYDDAGGGVLVAAHEITYLTPLVHREAPVPIDIWVTKVGGASFHLAYEVHDPEDDAAGGTTVYARAASTLVPYDFRSERPRRITAAEREYLQRHLAPSPAGA